MNVMSSVRSSNAGMTSEALRDLTVASISDDKGEEIRIIDLQGKTSLADYVIIASGRSSRHVSSMAENLAGKMKMAGISAKDEGMAQGDWVLLDGGDVIVHLIRPEIRAFYNLEKLWGAEAPVQLSTELPLEEALPEELPPEE